jgi:hypothetical protein
MGFIAAGLAVAAVGAGVSAYGASKNASAMRDANQDASAAEDALFSRQSDNLNKLIRQKNKKLHNLGNIFDRFESTGAFGDTDTLKNLRTAQEDFSQLAAGDFTGFESQLRKSMSDALINTTGSGSPVGSFAQLAADTQMNYRKEGIQTSVGISDFLSAQANQLLGAEFGIMDQKFQSQYELDRSTTSNKANFNLGAAATEGVGMSAFGGALSQIGGSVASYGMFRDNQATQNRYLGIAEQQAASMGRTAGRSMVPNYTPPAYNGPTINSSGYGSNVTETEANLPTYPTIDTWNAPRVWGSEYWQPKGYYPEGYEDPTMGGMVLPNKGVIAQNSSMSTLSNLGARIARA